MLGLVLFLMALQTREMIRYKLIIYEDHIYIAANRDLFLTRHKDMIVQYDGIQTLQYCRALRPELINEGMFYFSAIYITRQGTKKEEYVLTMWFSKKQVQYLLAQMKAMAENYNNSFVEILDEKI